MIETSTLPQMDSRLDSRIAVKAKFLFEGDRKFFVKGVTYGPFAPDEKGDHFGRPETARRDMELIRAMGANLLRVYYVPPRWFLDLCGEFGLRVLISLPWAEHIDFLRTAQTRREIERSIVSSVQMHRGHPAVFGYLVGNEIPSSLVRWLGPQRVIEFVEELIAAARAEDPDVLYSYASYPPTEYLLPQNVDFYTYNVYLHRREDFERYLARLQNLAGDKPLVMGEFGMDTIRHSQEEQAEMLEWHIESVVRGGLAGTVLYAWTDEWFRGGMEITDWAFGLVTRDRQPKKAYETVRKLFEGNEPITRKVALPRYPSVSVIVCSYNGAKTLGDCLRSLDRVDYPDFEIILVDDGSKDNTQEVVREWLAGRKPGPGGKLPGFQNIVQKNMGLSYARNAGAAASKAEVYVYTDSDCMADPDWLYYLMGTLLSGEYVGVGGPNISPPAVNWVQASVAAAPGGPSHVLLTDVVAEHIPGCNMAFHAAAFWSVGGFDTEYRKAGDDVDFCWRLQSNGGVIAFSPSAIVWHYRRFTLQAFKKQQEGYGEAESMLRFKHLVFFGPTGTAKWKGQIYGATRFTWLGGKPIIYHGVLGSGLFQSVYPAPQSEIAAYLSSIEWVALTVFIGVLSIPLDVLRIVPYLMFGGTFLVALSYMMNARIEPAFDTIRARLLVAFLALAQPLVRGWARYFTWLKFKRTPQSVIAAPEAGFKPVPGVHGISRLTYWSENGKGREELLAEIISALETEGWRYSTDTGWTSWDLQIYGNFWWTVKLRTVTEYHGGPKCLTRVRLSYKPVVLTVLFNIIVLSILGYRQWTTALADLWWWIPYAIFLGWLSVRAFRLKKRVAQLVQAAATRCDMTRVTNRGKAAPSS